MSSAWYLGSFVASGLALILGFIVGRRNSTPLFCVALVVALVGAAVITDGFK